MLDHVAIQAALRARLLTLVVCTTGSTSLSATANGYVRTTGSFLTDGFALGMEVTPAGFAANAVDVITGVTALTLTTRNAHGVETAAGSRSLTVGLPASREWENEVFTPVTGVPYLDEQFAHGAGTLDTIGPNGRLTGEPMYFPRINVPTASGVHAAKRYADAVINLFPPGDKLILANGDTVEVRGDQTPYTGQVLQGRPGFAGVLCSIPLRCRAINSR